MPVLQYQAYRAWDAPARRFHGINALTVVGLIGTGMIVLSDDTLGLSSGENSAEEHPRRYRLSDGH
jgi:hypothetical protein